MSLLRSAEQAGLNELLTASRKSAGHLRDAAAFLDRDSVPGGPQLRQLAARREQSSRALDEAIRRSGDFPSAVDEDRLTVEKLFQRIHASLARNEVDDLLIHLLEGEKNLAGRLAELQTSAWADPQSRVLNDLQMDLDEAIATLRRLERGGAV